MTKLQIKMAWFNIKMTEKLTKWANNNEDTIVKTGTVLLGLLVADLILLGIGCALQ